MVENYRGFQIATSSPDSTLSLAALPELTGCVASISTQTSGYRVVPDVLAFLARAPLGNSDWENHS